MSDHLRTLSVSLDDFRQLAGELRLYAVLDTCDAPAIQSKVAELGASKALCLFRGEVDPEILEVAPYLARVDDPLLQWLVATVWKEPWGIFLVTKWELKVIRKHLRKFLTVQNPEGKPMYFRYYDPRVLPAFLATCSPQELDSFFGGISAFGHTAETTPAGGFLIHRL